MIALATLNQDLSQVVGTQVSIVCESDATFNPAWDGYTLAGADGSILHVLHIRQTLCVNAENVDRKRNPHPYGLATNGLQVDEDGGTALLTILHEAIHVGLQSTNEGLVECTAIQNRWAFVKLLKLAASASASLMAGMLANHEATINQFPSYRYGAC